MKKFIAFLIILCLLIIGAAQTGLIQKLDFMRFTNHATNSEKQNNKKHNNLYVNGGIATGFKADGNYFYSYKNGEWHREFIAGVNIGAGKPGIFPGELSISYDEYYRWFKYIAEMNANTVRVYTTQRPQFYTALYDYNKQAKKPIYLMHGVWMDEDDITSLSDVYAQGDKILNDFLKDAKNIVDVLHGDITLEPRAGYASGSYTSDVSEYVIGWIIGMEWDPNLVINTNESNPDRAVYNGKYLYTENTTPFEAFLCTAGDKLIEYETEKYKHQSPISFANWVTTDPLTHNNEPHQDEDKVSVNMENIKSTEKYLPGQFLCYHVYPYYPDCLNYDPDYVNYKDPEGKINSYRAYLKDLKSVHSLPILIGEFGIPASRGMAHQSVPMGYNQGMVDETESGAMILDMFNSMYEENYAGGIVFIWQDEWFKRTWNNREFDIPDRRPFWSNPQTNEQQFGLLAFDPGREESICYVDGDVSDWSADTPLINQDKVKMFVKSDERYLYIMVDAPDYDFDQDTLLIPVDTKDNQGNIFVKDTNITLEKAADFLIQINGKDNSRILCDSYYDVFYYLYGEQYKMIPENPDIRKKNSGVFDKMMMCYNYELTLPLDKTVIPFLSFETGKLTYGNANPKSKEYKSLSDFIFKDGKLEIKIPWQLLNVMDPSEKKIMDDFYLVQGILPINADIFSFGAGIMKSSGNINVSMSGEYSWQGWKMPTFHERLKPAYYVLQEGLKKYS